MRKLFPALLAASFAFAVVATTQLTYAAAAADFQTQRTPSAEILRFHAVMQATMQRALDQPTLPAFVIPPPPPKV